MKLYFSPTSPFVRKVAALAIETGIADRIEMVRTNPHEKAPEFLAANPLGKIPAFETDDGMVLVDSPVICEHLDSLHSGPKLFPETGPARWVALNLHAMAQGILENAVMRRAELMRDEDDDREANIAKLGAGISRTLDTLEQATASLEGSVTIGNLTVAVALGYLDFRYANEPWRLGRERLAAWCETFSERPSLAQTVPADPA